MIINDAFLWRSPILARGYEYSQLLSRTHLQGGAEERAEVLHVEVLYQIVNPSGGRGGGGGGSGGGGGGGWIAGRGGLGQTTQLCQHDAHIP